MFHPLAAIAVKELLKTNSINSVCELGNQRLDKTLHSSGVSTVKEWYASKGVNEYTAIDVNEDKDATIMDLNTILKEEYDYEQTFDFVTNNGTTEHLLDQRAAFTNMHNLCRVGGILLCILPFTRCLNHGFYNYNPCLFRDLAEANDYQWEFLWLSNRWGDRVETGPIKDVFVEKNSKILKGYVDKILSLNKGDVFVVTAYKKTKNDDFKLPFEYQYQKDIKDDKLRKKYV